MERGNGANVFAQDVEDGTELAFAFFVDECVHAFLEVGECFGHGRVEGDECAGAVGAGADRAKLKAVAREGKGRGAVAVGVVNHQFGNLGNVQTHAVLAFQREEFVLGRVGHALEEFAELAAEEGRYDGRRCLATAQSVGVGGAHDGGFEEAVVAIDAHERLDDEGDEAQVVLGRLAGGVEENTRVGGEAPVVVFARAVDAGKGLFVEQAAESVLARHAGHERHEQHIVVNGQVAFLEDGGEFKLVGGHLVVARLAGDAEFEGADFEVAHKFGHTFGDGAEVVVVHLLVLAALVPHQGAARQEEVGACGIEALVNEEIFLLPTEVGADALHIGAEIAGYGSGGAVDGSQGFLERCLVVKGLARVGDKYGGNHQRVADDENGRGGVPGGIAAGLEGGADAAVGETGSVGLLLHEFLAAEVFYHAALAIVLYEGVVLLGRTFGERLKPVGAVCGTHFHGPTLHALGHLVGHAECERCALFYGFAQFAIGVEGQVLEHLLLVEHVACEILGGTAFGGLNGDWALFERLFNNFKSETGHWDLWDCILNTGLWS